MQITAKPSEPQGRNRHHLQQASTDLHSASHYLLQPAQFAEPPQTVSNAFKKPKKSVNVVSNLKPAKDTNQSSNILVAHLSNLGNFGDTQTIMKQTQTIMKTAFGNRNHSQDHNSSKKV